MRTDTFQVHAHASFRFEDDKNGPVEVGALIGFIDRVKPLSILTFDIEHHMFAVMALEEDEAKSVDYKRYKWQREGWPASEKFPIPDDSRHGF